jgi:ribosomal-protein-alanine N-acetyltransferase
MVGEDLKKIVICDVLAEDLPSVLEIERESFTTPWSETSFYNELKNPRSIVKAARKEGRIVGYACVSRTLDEGHILDLAVHPGFRRRGVAKMLVSRAIEELGKEGCRFIFLEVRVSNEPAARLYGKLGFERIGIRKNYYTLPEEDGVLMCLKLGDGKSD